MCSVVSACCGLKKNMISFQGMSGNVIKSMIPFHRQAPARRRAFKCPETSGMMWSSRKGEVLKTGSLLTSLGSGVEQPQLLVILAALGSRTDWQWCALKFCVGLQNGLGVVLHFFSVLSPLLGRTEDWNFLLQLSIRQHAEEHWEGERGW